MKEGLDKLIRFQGLELHQEEMARNLNGLPVEHDLLEKKLEAERDELEHTLQDLRVLELKQKQLDGDRTEVEATIRRLRGQLLEVKKNDQYQAILQEIETFEKQVSDLEEEEIEALMEIDEEKLRVADAEQLFRDQENVFKTQFDHLEERKGQLEASIDEMKETLTTSKAEVSPEWAQAYARVKNQVHKGPWAVQLQGGRCMGCHLTVSNEAAQNFGQDAGVNHCDLCGRILYLA